MSFSRPAHHPTGNMRRWALVILIAVAAVVLPGSIDVAYGAGGTYHQGRKLATQLHIRRALNVDGAILRELLDRLQADYQICILLDRRIDPSTRLSCRIPLVETAVLLRRVADEIPNCGVSILDDLVYFGPRDHAGKLRTLIELKRRRIRELRREITKSKYALLTTPSSVGWDHVAVPRDVVLQLLINAGLETSDADRIQHDLWHPRQLPILNVMDALTLILFQFELTAEFVGETPRLSIVPLPERIEVERRHTIPKAFRKTARTLIEQRYPQLTARWARSSVQISGTLELHTEIDSLLAGELPDASSPETSLKERILTLSLQPGVSLRQVVTHLDESGIAIRYEEELESMLDQEVTAKLDNLPAVEFFRTLFAELPVEVEVTDDEVVLQIRDVP